MQLALQAGWDGAVAQERPALLAVTPKASTRRPRAPSLRPVSGHHLCQTVRVSGTPHPGRCAWLLSPRECFPAHPWPGTDAALPFMAEHGPSWGDENFFYVRLTRGVSTQDITGEGSRCKMLRFPWGESGRASWRKGDLQEACEEERPEVDPHVGRGGRLGSGSSSVPFC